MKLCCLLTAAVDCGHHEIVWILLHNGMDLFDSTQCIGSAVESAVQNSHAEILHTLLGYPNGDDDTRRRRATWTLPPDDTPLLHVAVLYGHLATVSALLAAGAPSTQTGGAQVK